MPKYVVFFMFVSLCCTKTIAQDYDPNYFDPPVRHKIVLSGSFAEIRGSHFHTGLDIKSAPNVKSDTIYASADGFVSRIRAARGGYGRSIYIDHPNGYTTVYGHLKAYNITLSNYVLQKQNQLQTYELDIYPEPGLLEVSKGQAIGIMGNSGRSFGVHLHYEVRHTNSEVPQNPMLFGIKPADHKAPTIGSVSVHVLDDQKEKQWRQSLLTKRKNGKYQILEQLVPASKVGVSINCIDQMDGASNRNGIYNLKMFVDDTLYFGCTFNEMSFDDFRKISTYIDYDLRESSRRTEAMCFKIPSNNLSIFDTLKNEGVFSLTHHRDVRFEVRDIDGNLSIQNLKLSRFEQDLKVPTKTYQKKIDVGARETYTLNDLTIQFGPNSLVYTNFFNVNTAKNKKGDLIYKIGNYKDPLLKNLKASLNLDARIEAGIEESDYEKLIFAHLTSTGKPVSYGATVENKVINTYLGAFGDYKLMIDDVAPTIVAQTFSPRSKSGSNFRFILDDNIRSAGNEASFVYDVFIDDNWIACEYKSLTKVLTVPIGSLKKGDHNLKIETHDCRNNSATWERDFVVY